MSKKTSLQQWFLTFGIWFRDSELGSQEAAMPNNHAAWHLAQTVAFLRFGGATNEARTLLHERAVRLATQQIAADGSQPEELPRTLSFDYSVYNLYAWCMIGYQAHQLQVELDPLYYDKLAQAVEFMIPFSISLTKETTWTWQQIKPMDTSRLIAVFHWASFLCKRPNFQTIAEQLMIQHHWQHSYRAVLFSAQFSAQLSPKTTPRVTE